MNTQSAKRFIADDFEIPLLHETTEYRLRMLAVDDVEKDYDAVMSSVDHLKNVWPGSGWPNGVTLEKNLEDLERHQREFLSRSSFAYTVVTLDESQVIGCVYINPTRKLGHDAEVYLWVRESELENGLDGRLHETVTRWLADNWPFDNPAMPGREIDWDDWNSLTQDAG